MRRNLVAVAAATALMLAGSIAVGVAPTSAVAEGNTMLFGRPLLGSGCLPPECSDDRSFHAMDKIQPGAISIQAGGTVNFEVAGFHQVAIYEPGVSPRDIEPQGAFPFVNDPEGRVFLGPIASTQYTFAEPGRYLVICNITPHLEESQMWGWVQVR